MEMNGQLHASGVSPLWNKRLGTRWIRGWTQWGWDNFCLWEIEYQSFIPSPVMVTILEIRILALSQKSLF
jgi:hypothetical protein